MIFLQWIKSPTLLWNLLPVDYVRKGKNLEPTSLKPVFVQKVILKRWDVAA